AVYRLNATTRIAELVKDVNTKYIPHGIDGKEGAAEDGAQEFTAVGSSIIFTAADRWTKTVYPDPPQGNLEPWVSDGTAAGTVKLKEIARRILGSNAQSFAPIVGP